MSRGRALLLLVLAVPGAAARAGDGRKPVHKPTSWPFVINAEGSWYLTEDLTVPATTTGVSITANDVTFDLNGHTIRTASGCSTLVSAVNVTNVRVTNGQIAGGCVGVSLTRTTGGSSSYRVDHLHLQGQVSTGIYISGASGALATGVIEANNISYSTDTSNGHGIAVAYLENGRIQGNGVESCGSDGIRVSYSSGVAISDNTSCFNGLTTGIGSGISLYQSSACTISHNVTSGNKNHGIALDGNMHEIAYNTTSDNDVYGISTFQSVSLSIHHNTACGNGSGIYLNQAWESTVANNSASSNASYGIYMYSCIWDSVDWNVAAGNNSCPIYLASSDYNVLTYNRTPRSAACGTNGIFQDGSSTNNTTSSNLPTTP